MLSSIRGAAGLLAILSAGSIFAADLRLYADRPPTPAELTRWDTKAKFEPPFGSLLGAFIDLDRTNPLTYLDMTNRLRRLPEGFEAKTGRRHASYFFYLGYGHRVPVDWISKLGANGRAVQIALEPNEGLDKVQEDATLYRIADGFAATNAPIFLRWASEMNGPWVRYSGDPKKYREKFRLVSRVMRERAPNVAMVWVPYAKPQGNITQYYPGDDAVDWVGVNMYSVTYYNQDVRTPGYQDHPTKLLNFIYDTYSPRRPVMIAEFGATHFSALEGKSVADFARRSIQGLYDALPRLYPRVKAVYYFNTNNLELSHRLNNNYAITQDPEVLATYRDVVSQPYFLESLRGKPSVAPFALVANQALSGVVRISAFGTYPKPQVRMRFLVNGAPVHTSGPEMDWSFDLDTTRYPAGPATVSVEASTDGKRIASTSVRVLIRR